MIETKLKKGILPKFRKIKIKKVLKGNPIGIRTTAKIPDIFRDGEEVYIINEAMIKQIRLQIRDPSFEVKELIEDCLKETIQEGR